MLLRSCWTRSEQIFHCIAAWLDRILEHFENQYFSSADNRRRLRRASTQVMGDFDDFLRVKSRSVEVSPQMAFAAYQYLVTGRFQWPILVRIQTETLQRSSRGTRLTILIEECLLRLPNFFSCQVLFTSSSRQGSQSVPAKSNFSLFALCSHSRVQ